MCGDTTTFSKEDNLELKCPGQGKPDSTLTLTTKEITEDLTNVKTTEMTHTLSLGYMDTGVYVCSDQNNQRADDDTNLTPSPLYSVEYTVSVAPFGVVKVTISVLVKADNTNYTLKVENGVGNAPIYTFLLNEGFLKYTSVL
ncbi:hypothetical protein RRG08_041343 [Elysia crispata]|uniref:Ig-like domain-containing protein n=1 Tax=Elysia crispata TaxID=231223 RepID=A0AAE1BBA0_9GAST|nr:hypothetical protein RRG08_041343 [Elysia crispata]